MKKIALVLFAAVSAGVVAQSAQVGKPLPVSPVAGVANRQGWEFGALVQGGKGFTDDRDDFKFFMVGGHLGKVITHEIGHSWLKGNFEYAGELFPLWQSYTPKFQRSKCVGNAVTYSCSQPYTVGGTFTGISITPILLRWNFTSGKRIMPFAQGGGGVIWTNHKYPAYPLPDSDVNYQNMGPSANTSVWNFTPQFGIGMHIFTKQNQSFDLGANAVHISSASLGDRNPGVNASVQFTAGYTWWK